MPLTPDAVAVIGGTGAAGFGLAARWAAAGIEVIVGSRDAERAEEAAAQLRSLFPDARARGLANPDAAASAPAVVVAVPYAGQAAIYKSIAEHVGDAVVVDCTVPLAASVGGKAAHVLGVWEGSAAQQGAARLPEGVKVCAAFHSLSASALAEVETPCQGDVLVCGPRGSAQGVVRELVEAIPDLRYVNAGPLENARYVEPLTALLIGINRRYKTDGAGLRITGI